MNASNPGNPVFRRSAGDAARVLAIKLEIIEVKDQSELPDAFGRMRLLRVEGLAIIPDPVLDSNSVQIAQLARGTKAPMCG
jgi:hypothetical protein